MRQRITVPETSADPKPSATAATGAPPSRFTPRLIFLAAIAALGLLLRVYRLDDQSAWCDELNFFFLPVSDFKTYMSIVQLWCPDNVPLYYILFYAWSRVFGISLIAARMFTILCGVACIPLAYAIGRRVSGVRAGQIAAVCVALSPFQIWHAQSMRPYGMCIPLVLVSIYALLRAREAPRVWYGVALAANLLLLWTHAFMAFLIPIQALYLLGIRPNGLRRAVGWGLAHVFVVLPPYLWLRPRLLNVPEAGYDHFSLPGLWWILIDLVGDDVMRYSSEFPIADPAWTGYLPGYAVWRPSVGIGLMILLGLLALCAIPKAMARWRQGEPGLVLVLGAATLPVLMLVCLSYLWRPCIETRHTPYCSAALYVTIAVLITSIRRPRIRRAVLAAVLALLSLELAFYLPAVSRTPWRAAARHIQQRQRPNDIILVKGIIHWAPDAFRANQIDHSIPVIPAYTIDAVCERTAAFFARQSQERTPGNDDGRVWAVIEMAFLYPHVLQEIFADCLGPVGVTGSYVLWPGMQGVLVCRFTRNAPWIVRTAPASTDRTGSLTDYQAILNDLGLANLDTEQKARALDALRRTVDIPFPVGKNTYAELSAVLSEERAYDMAEPCARRSIAMLSEYGWAHFALALALAGKGDTPAALEGFRQAFSLDYVLESLYGDLVHALYEEPNADKAAREMARLAETAFPYPTLRRLFLAAFPRAYAPDPGRRAMDPLARKPPDAGPAP